MPTAAYYTLGCKVNQCETEDIRQEMEGLGFATVSFASPADVYIINSCTVTGMADSKSRQAIRRATRVNPDAFVVATGCYAELDPASVSRIAGVDLVAGNEEKASIPERVTARFPGLKPNGSVGVRPRVRTRAMVKVQDGCGQFCADCAVPLARSRQMSRAFEEVIGELRQLAAFGYKEVVLSGIRLGSYEHGLPGLIRAAGRIEGIERIRLSSIEVWEIGDDLLAAMSESPKVCRHLHVPLQSGDDGVLARMRRPYNTAGYAGTIERARKAIPGLGLTTDVMVGFPGESHDQFERTCGFVRETPFSRLHVFRYSPRRGTAASSMDGQIAEQVKTQRSDRLTSIGRNLAREFAHQLAGETVRVLVEARRTELLSGFTDNYVEVRFAGSPSLRGTIVTVRIERADESGAAGSIVRTEERE